MEHIGPVLFWLIVGYAVLAPDSRTLAATRGLAGAIRGGLRGSLSSSSGKSTSSRSKSSAKSAAATRGRAMLDGWREGVATAQQARAEGRDAWSRASRAAGRSYGAAQSVAVGAKGLQDRARTKWASRTTSPEGDDVDVSKWTRTADGHPVVQGEVIDDHLDDDQVVTDGGDVIDITTKRSAAGTGPAAAETEAASAAGFTTTGGTGDMNARVAETELASVDEVHAEATSMLAVVVALLEEEQQTDRWKTGLADRWSAAPWSTALVDASVNQIADADAISEEMVNGLKAVIKACEEARAVGEAAAAQKARGDLSAYAAS